MQSNDPIFLNNPSTRDILREVVDLIPEDVEVYLFAGAVRNALHFVFFNEEMVQRDFDCIIIGNAEKFAENLISAGFEYGSKNSEKAKIFKKPRVCDPVHQYDDWVYLDCKIFPSENSIEDVLRKITDFTLSGVALNLRNIYLNNWMDRIIALPTALEDIQNKIIREVNQYPLNIYKIIRLISQGFTISNDIDIERCASRRIEAKEERLHKEIKKTVNYVGGKENAQDIIEELGIKEDILNLN